MLFVITLLLDVEAQFNILSPCFLFTAQIICFLLFLFTPSLEAPACCRLNSWPDAVCRINPVPNYWSHTIRQQGTSPSTLHLSFNGCSPSETDSLNSCTILACSISVQNPAPYSQTTNSPGLKCSHSLLDIVHLNMCLMTIAKHRQR